MLEDQRKKLLTIILVVINHRLSIVDKKLEEGYDMEWLKNEIKNIAFLQEEAARLDKKE